MPLIHPSLARRVTVVVAIVVLALACALPWLRNRDRLHDLMDYAVVMSAVGRIDAGEKPYVDFVTPAQAGYLHFNRLVEKAAGSTYLGLTYGGIGLVVIGTCVLGGILCRRWPLFPALAVAGTIIASTASQHTILWYNASGAVYLAVAAWSAAIAPRLERRHAGWHTLLALSLLIGGLNKINFQLVALGAVACFILREALLHSDTRQRALGLGVFALFFGLVLPSGLELMLTGASLHEWFHNVLGIAGPGRAAYLGLIATWKFYVAPPHDYYGPLLIPQVGAVVVAGFAATLIWGWRGRPNLDRVLLAIATTGFTLAALALLATNIEIAYVGLGSGVALATALALGFELRPRPRLTGLLHVLPVLLIGTAAGWSAWQGQRSLFGRPSIARSSYVSPGGSFLKFRYIAGVKIPPELAASLVDLAEHLPSPRADGTYPVYFTSGLEWLDRIWQPVRIAGLPLWFHHGTSAGEREGRVLVRALTHPELLRRVYATVPWDTRTPEIDRVLLDQSDPPSMHGTFIRSYRLRTNQSVPRDVFHRLLDLGANFDPDLLQLGPDTSFLRTSAGRPLIGTTSGSANFLFHGRADRLSARAVLRRSGAAANVATSAIFRIEAMVDDSWHELRTEKLELPSGQTQVDSLYVFDAANHDIRFSVAIAGPTEAPVEAGWAEPSIVHGPQGNSPPPRLFTNAQEDDPPLPPGSPAARNTLVDRAAEVLTRGATIQPAGFILKPGGQIWLKIGQGPTSLDGTVQCLANPEGELPVIRLLWVSGDRIQVLDQFGLTAVAEERQFHGNAPGPNGWFGLLVDPNYAAGPVSVRLEPAPTGR